MITAFDSGLNTVMGDLRLQVREILEICTKYEDDSFSKTYTINRPGTKRPLTWKSGLDVGGSGVKTAKVHLSFKSFAYAPPNQATPLMMINRLMSQAVDPSSRLLQASNVLGPSFHEIKGAWDELNIYLSSVYDEFHAERKFLTKCVFPALANKCLGLRIKLKWHDSSSAEAPGRKDNVARRVSTLQNCVMRCHDHEKQFIFVALVGERRGRLLDDRDLRRLKNANYTRKGGPLEWVEHAHANKGLSVQELEICMATNATSESLDASVENPCTVLCLRDAGFMESPDFMNAVPSDVRRLYRETNAQKQAAAVEFRKLLKKKMKDNLVNYKPRFDSFDYDWQEGVNTNEHNAAQSVHLAGLLEMGCGVHEKLWRTIRQRFPSSRGKASGNFYLIEMQRQKQLLVGLVQQMVLVRGGTQLKTIQKLKACAYFFEESQSDVTFFLGSHGSGRSSIIAQLLWDMQALQDEGEEKNRVKLKEDSDGPSKLKAKVLGMQSVLRMGTTRRPNNTGNGLKSPLNAGAGYMNIADDEDHEQTRGMSSHGTAEHRFFYGIDGPMKTELEEQEALFEQQLETAQERMASMGLDTREIKIRLKKPMLVFFFKQATHSTQDVVRFLCSSLLEEQDVLPASWKRLQQIVHVTCLGDTDSVPDNVQISNFARPVLFVLDGLDRDEWNEVRRIVVQFPGRCRAIMSVHDSARPSLSAKTRETFRQMPPQIVMACPLNIFERHEMLMELLRRTGAARLPTNLNCVTNHPHSAAPIYLKCLAACIKAHMHLQIKPPVMSSYFPHLVHLLNHNFLAMLDDQFGQLTVQVYCLNLHVFYGISCTKWYVTDHAMFPPNLSRNSWNSSRKSRPDGTWRKHVTCACEVHSTFP